MPNSKSLKLPLILWASVTLYFAFQFILRMTPALMIDDIMQDFNVDALTFSTLTGFYYLGYAGMQIPFGIMLDRYNFRYVTILAIIICISGNIIFTNTHNWSLLILGRFLIGAGSAIGFLSVAKVIKLFFDEKFHSLMIGMSFTFGLTGAVFGNKPLMILFNQFGPILVLKAVSLVGLIIALIIFSVNDNKAAKIIDTAENNVTLNNIISLFKNPLVVITGISGGLMVGSLEGFADLWAIKYFSDIYGYSKVDASFAGGFFFFGMCVGGPILAFFANLARSETLIIFFAGFINAIIFSCLFYFQGWNYNLLCAAMFIMGILACYQVLVFSFTSKKVSKSLNSIAIAIVNCINMSFGSLFHKAIGFLISCNPYETLFTANISQCDHSYYNYVTALAVIPIAALFGQMGFLYLSYKHRNKTI